MALSEIQIELLNQIQKNLIRGDVSQIAKTLGMSRVYVSNVLSPSIDLYRDEIVEAAVRHISSRDQKTKRLTKKVALLGQS
jgi:hypothetical protein